MRQWKCGYHYGIKLIVFGLFILINEYWLNIDWPKFLGFLFLIFGAIKLFLYKSCSCDAGPATTKVASRKKR